MADHPKWRQIAEDLRLKIESGDVGSAGKPLPTELELQDQYGASRNTVRDAIRWLAGLNLVYTRSGQGTFVTQKIEPFVTKLSTDPLGDEGSVGSESSAFASEVTLGSRQATVSVPRVEIQQTAGISAQELLLAEGASVVSRHQRRLIDGVPWSLQTTFYPMRLVEQGAVRLIQAEDISQGAVNYIEQVLAIKQAGWRDRFTVRVPDATETTFFGLPDDGRIAMIEIIRTGYDATGEPFRVTITSYPADRNQFVMEYGKVPDAAADAQHR